VIRLLLGSHGVSALPKLLGKSADGLRVAFVPTPAGPDAEQAPWVQADRRQLEILGCRISTLELATAEPGEVAAALHEADAVFVTGGNAYLVLWYARHTGFATLVPRLVEEGSLVYVGTSAGAMLAGPDIEPGATPAGRDAAPPLESTTGLRLVPLRVLPHDQEPERHAMNKAILEAHGREGFVALRDDQAILVRGESVEIVASPVLESRPSGVVPYDPAWPRLFEAEAERLEKALGPWLEGGIHHVGSTAVPGMAAKPIIDMLAGVHSLEEARAAEQPLAERGYVYRIHRPEAHLFVKASYGIHLTEPGSDLWRERLAFRDALRADPGLRREYAEWKRVHGGGKPYSASKTPFIGRVLAGMDITLKPDEERLVSRPPVRGRTS
jgi:GrpB-like predicted nucleotidyltransferase (UPF0157 family)/peptidase E